MESRFAWEAGRERATDLLTGQLPGIRFRGTNKQCGPAVSRGCLRAGSKVRPARTPNPEAPKPFGFSLDSPSDQPGGMRRIIVRLSVIGVLACSFAVIGPLRTLRSRLHGDGQNPRVPTMAGRGSLRRRAA